MSKLGLLKDSDFKLIHDRKLPVSADDYYEGLRFEEMVTADVKFLENLRIMDYSLFLIILEMPPSAIPPTNNNTAIDRNDHPNMTSAEEIKIQCNELDLNQLKEQQQEHQNNQDSLAKYTVLTVDDPERRAKEEEFMQRLDELRAQGRIVMFSPSRRFVYIMGLIDYLGKWNMNRRLEMLTKQLRAHFIR